MSKQPRIPATAALLSAIVLCLAAGCRQSEPFPYDHVSGKVTYEDGSLISTPILKLTFVPLAKPADPKTCPPSGEAAVNTADGAFSEVTSHKRNDGIVRGRHKVLVLALDKDMRPTGAVPAEYLDPNKTPLEVDSAASPFELKVRKPAKR